MDDDEFLDMLGNQPDDLGKEEEPETVVSKVESDKPEEIEDKPEKPELSELEKEAQSMGHTSKDEWTAAGKDPDRWKTPHEYVEFGKIKKQMDEQKANFDERLTANEKLHKAKLAAEIKALEALKRTAVEEADTEKYDKTQKEIDDLKASDKPAVKEDDPRGPEIAAWEAKNPWVNDPSQTVSVRGVQVSKAVIANDAYSRFLATNPNATQSAALAAVDVEMAKLNEPANNPRRDTTTSTERPTAPIKKNPNRISMNDISAEDKAVWNNMEMAASIWPDGKGGRDEKKFLQSIVDAKRTA